MLKFTKFALGSIENNKGNLGWLENENNILVGAYLNYNEPWTAVWLSKTLHLRRTTADLKTGR